MARIPRTPQKPTSSKPPRDVLLDAYFAYRYEAHVSGDETSKAVAAILFGVASALAGDDVAALTQKNGPHAWARAWMRAHSLSHGLVRSRIASEAVTRPMLVRELLRTIGNTESDAMAIGRAALGVLVGRHAALGLPPWPDHDALLLAIVESVQRMKNHLRSDPDAIARTILRAAGLSQSAATNAVYLAL